jgi:hypothetical protein
VLVRHGDEAWSLAPLRMSLGDGFLIEADFGPGGEKDVLHAGFGHGRDHGVAVVVGGNLDPSARVVAKVPGVLVHETLLLSGRVCSFRLDRQANVCCDPHHALG